MAKTTITEDHKNISVVPSELLQIIDYICSPYNTEDASLKKSASIMVWGPPGIGKSALIASYARQRGRRLVALHLPQFDPVDIKGIPVKMEDGSIRWVPTSYLPQMHSFLVSTNNIKHDIVLPWKYAEDLQLLVYNASGKLVCSKNDGDVPDFENADFSADVRWVGTGKDWKISFILKSELPTGERYKVVIADKAVIFLDELSAAEPSTQNAALQLVLDKKVNEYEVPFHVPVFAAGNGEGDGAFVQGMSLPLANRFTHFNLIVSVQEWLDWAEAVGISPIIWGYIKHAGLKALVDSDLSTITDGNYGFRTPRSWTALSDQLLSGEVNRGLRKLPANCLKAVIAGNIGRTGAMEFLAYLATYDLLPDTDDILDGKVYVIDDKVKKSHMWGLIMALGSKLKDRYVKYYDKKLPANKQCKEWVTTTDSILRFINHLEGDIGTFFMTRITNVFDIRIAAFKCCTTEDFDVYAEKYDQVFVNSIHNRKS